MNIEDGGMKMENLKLALIAAALVALSSFSALAQSSERTWGSGSQALTQATSDIHNFVLKHKPEIKKSMPQKSKFDYSQTAYAKLDKLFSQGVPVSREDMTGAFIGRCYEKDKPNIPIRELLVGGPIAASSADNGPLFSDETPAIFRVNIVAFSNLSDSKGNNLDSYPNVDSFLENNINDESIQSQISQEIKSGEVLKDSSADEDHFSKANGYILEKERDTSHHWGYRCYFFKKIHD